MIDEFALIKCIGKGAFGEVYLTSKKGSSQLYATKKVPKNKIESSSIKKYFLNEISILRELNHKNIIKLETIRQTIHNYYIITEYYNGGGLSDCLKRYKQLYGRNFTEEIVQHLMRQIIEALRYLHGLKIIHRDLKLDNLLINFESEEDKNNLNMLKAQVKVIDFGFATYLEGANLRYSILGSPINMDPILLTKLNNKNFSYLLGYNEKADIWSLGTVCYELITGEGVFIAANLVDLVNKVEHGIYHLPLNLSQEIISFINCMLQYNGKNRLSADELAQHPFLVKNVNEFTKLDLTKLTNLVDSKGLIINIKREEDKNPLYNLQSQQNYPQQRIYYQYPQNNVVLPQYQTTTYNFKNNIGYNYYQNNGPKYYMASVNGTNNVNKMQYYEKMNAKIIEDKKNLKRIFSSQEKNKLKQNNNIINNVEVKHKSVIPLPNKSNSNNINYINKITNNSPSRNKNPNNPNINSYKSMERDVSPNNKKILVRVNSSKSMNTVNSEKIQYPYQIGTTYENENTIQNIQNYLNQDQTLMNNNKLGIPNIFPFTYSGQSSNKNNSTSSDIYNNQPNSFSENNFDRREISSDAIDGIFDFNIGNELAPDPNFVINSEINKKIKLKNNS